MVGSTPYAAAQQRHEKIKGLLKVCFPDLEVFDEANQDGAPILVGVKNSDRRILYLSSGLSFIDLCDSSYLDQASRFAKSYKELLSGQPEMDVTLTTHF